MLRDLEYFYKHTAPNEPNNPRYEDLRTQMRTLVNAWMESKLIRPSTQEYIKECKGEHSKRVRSDLIVEGGTIMSEALGSVDVYYDKYILNTYGKSLTDYYNFRVDDDPNDISDIEEKLADDSKSPVLLNAVYAIAGIGKAHPIRFAYWHSAAPHNLDNFNSPRDDNHPETAIKTLIQQVQGRIDAMKPVREALDAMFSQ